nr:hypothetical protein [uncultured Desulfobacter sp.]
MAVKNKYTFAKRQKELLKKKKQEEKKQRRMEKKDETEDAPEIESNPEA